MNNEIKIETGIPIPTRGALKWEFIKDLEIGQSFTTGLTLRMTVANTAKRHGIKITTRKINDSEMRVWRIS